MSASQQVIRGPLDIVCSDPGVWDHLSEKQIITDKVFALCLENIEDPDIKHIVNLVTRCRPLIQLELHGSSELSGPSLRKLLDTVSKLDENLSLILDVPFLLHQCALPGFRASARSLCAIPRDSIECTALGNWVTEDLNIGYALYAIPRLVRAPQKPPLLESLRFLTLDLEHAVSSSGSSVDGDLKALSQLPNLDGLTLFGPEERVSKALNAVSESMRGGLICVYVKNPHKLADCIGKIDPSALWLRGHTSVSSIVTLLRECPLPSLRDLSLNLEYTGQTLESLTDAIFGLRSGLSLGISCDDSIVKESMEMCVDIAHASHLRELRLGCNWPDASVNMFKTFLGNIFDGMPSPTEVADTTEVSAPRDDSTVCCLEQLHLVEAQELSGATNLLQLIDSQEVSYAWKALQQKLGPHSPILSTLCVHVLDGEYPDHPPSLL